MTADACVTAVSASFPERADQHRGQRCPLQRDRVVARRNREQGGSVTPPRWLQRTARNASPQVKASVVDTPSAAASVCAPTPLVSTSVTNITVSAATTRRAAPAGRRGSRREEPDHDREREGHCDDGQHTTPAQQRGSEHGNQDADPEQRAAPIQLDELVVDRLPRPRLHISSAGATDTNPVTHLQGRSEARQRHSQRCFTTLDSDHHPAALFLASWRAGSIHKRA